MLSLLRSFARSPIAIGFILAPIIMAFALFDVGGIFSGRGTAVVVIGNGQVSQAELSRAYQQEVQRRQREDLNFTTEQARAEQLGDQILNQLIMEAALNSKADELGLVISDDAFFNLIAADPNFQHPVTGNYDPDIFRRLVAQSQQTPRQFEELVRQDMRRRQLVVSLIGGIDAPADLAATRYLAAQEQRAMRALIIDASTAEAVAAPTDEELQAYIDGNRFATDSNNLPLFTAPEMRGFSLLRFRVQDYMADIEVDESVLRETYDYEVETGRIGTPATRSFIQLPTPDEATANDAAARLAAGEAADDVAAALGLDAPLTFEEATTIEIADLQLGEAVFAMPANTITALEGNFGWSAVSVTAAVEENTPTYEERRQELLQDAAQNDALDLLYDKLSAYETARADGATLDAAAEIAGLPLEIYQPIDRVARDTSGALDIQRFFGLGEDVLTAVFDTPTGFTTDVQQYNDTDFFVLEVNEVIAERPRELAEVRETAEARWRDEQVAIQLQARSDEALTRLQAGEDMDFVALTSGGRVELATLRRNETAASFSRGVVGQGFAQSVGQFEQVLQPAGLQQIILVVDGIVPGDTANAQLGELAQLSVGIDNEMVTDILMGVEDGLSIEYEIADATIDRRLRAAALGEDFEQQ